MKRTNGLVEVTAVATAILLGAGMAIAHCGKCEGDTKKPDDCAGGVCAAKPQTQIDVKAKTATTAPTLGVSELATLIQAKTPMVLLDARSGKWDDGRRIPGAKSLNAGSTKEEIEAIVPDKNALVITYCANLKCTASPMLAAHLKKLGYVNVIELPVGIDGWAEAGKEIVKEAK